MNRSLILWQLSLYISLYGTFDTATFRRNKCQKYSIIGHIMPLISPFISFTLTRCSFDVLSMCLLRQDHAKSTMDFSRRIIHLFQLRFFPNKLPLLNTIRRFIIIGWTFKWAAHNRMRQRSLLIALFGGPTGENDSTDWTIWSVSLMRRIIHRFNCDNTFSSNVENPKGYERNILSFRSSDCYYIRLASIVLAFHSFHIRNATVLLMKLFPCTDSL